MSKAAELAALIGSQTAQGNKNLIINGAMQVSQRSTSKSSVTSGEYPSIDRYYMNLSSLGTWTISQSTTTPSGQGFTTSLKLDCTTADASPSASDAFLVEQRIEAQNLQNLCYGTSSAKSLTLSFWVRSNKTGTYYTEIQHGEVGSNYFNNHSYSINSADTWEKKTIPITGQTDDVINNDNGTGMIVRWIVGAGSNLTSGTTTNNTWHQTAANRAAGQVNLADSTSNEWYLTGVQLEIGDVATAFEHEDFGTTLAKCQRYYYQTTTIGSSGVHYNLIGRISSTTQGYYTQELPTNLRTTPSIAANPAYNTGSSWHNNLSGVDNKAWSGAPVIGSCSNNVVSWYVTTAAWASGYVGMVTQPYTPTSVSSNYISYDAEL